MDILLITFPEKLGIFPGKYYINNPKLFKVYSLFHLGFNVGVYMYLCIAMLSLAKESVKNYTVISSVLMLLATLLTAIPLLYNCILYPEEYIRMRNHFSIVDETLKRNGVPLKNSLMLAKFIVFHVIYFACNVLVIAQFWNDFHPILCVFFLLPVYSWCLEVAVATQILEALRLRLFCLNKLIDTIYRVNLFLVDNEHSMKLRSVRKENKEVEIFDFIDIYQRITKITKIFNKLFGAFNVILVFTFILEFVAVIYQLVADLESSIVYVDLLSAVIHTVQWILFVIKAQQVIDEGNNLVENCLETTFRSLREHHVSPKWKESMAHLTMSVTTNFPQFTAAKFFAINYNSIFTIFNMMTGYIIVAVQFANTFSKHT